MFSETIYKWLDNALDAGIKESEFWDMTFAEINRAVASRQRLLKIEAKERATYDYVLADLIGRSVARIYNSSNKMPEIQEVYPSLFDAQEVQEQKATQKTKLSVARFKQFADAYNKRFKEVANKE